MDRLIFMQTKPILFISPLPPPQGGIAVWTQKIITEGLPDNTPVTLVDTRIRGKRNIFDPAFFSSAEMFRTMRIYFLLLYQLIIHRPQLIHLSCALSSAGVFRDAMCVMLAKIFRIPVITHYHGNMHDFNVARFGGRSGKVLNWLMRHCYPILSKTGFSLYKKLPHPASACVPFMLAVSPPPKAVRKF
jgi:hypothetical protein